jgi:uncharacterized protein (DUF486 family)
MPAIPVPVLTIGLLILSNLFMTFAWSARRSAGTTRSASC